MADRFLKGCATHSVPSSHLRNQWGGYHFHISQITAFIQNVRRLPEWVIPDLQAFSPLGGCSLNPVVLYAIPTAAKHPSSFERPSLTI
jgi:hypothetical protein